MYVLKYVSIYRIVYVLSDNKGTDNGKKKYYSYKLYKSNKPTHFCSCFFSSTL